MFGLMAPAEEFADSRSRSLGVLFQADCQAYHVIYTLEVQFDYFRHHPSVQEVPELGSSKY